MTPNKEEGMKCPVCGKVKLPRAMKNHIGKTAKEEVYRYYLWGNSKLAPEPAMPHQYFIEDNSTAEVKRVLNLETKHAKAKS